MINAPWYNDPVETLAFNTYAYHQQEIEDTISLIGNGATSIQCDTDMNALERAYIENEVQRRYGMSVNLS